MKDIFTKDIYRNPSLYYILVPIIVILWPLLIRGVYLPNAEDNWKQEVADCEKARAIINEILTIDPGRVDFADPNRSAVEFDYAIAVEKVAGLCRISPANYRLSSGRIITSDRQKSQNAKVVLEDVDMKRFADFLSKIQLRWANLQCTRLKLTKKKGLPDAWDVDMDFKYYY